MDVYDNPRGLLAAIVDSSDDAIITTNRDGIITSWNPAAQKMFGYTAQEVIGKPVQILIPADHLGEATLALRQTLRGERVEHHETVRQAKNGERLQVSLTVSPIVNGQGQVIGASKILRNITQEMRVREVLRQNEEQYRITLGSIGDAVIATDCAGRITFINPIAEQLTGWDASEALGTCLADTFNIVNEFSREPCENPVARILREGKVVALANHTILISKDGSEHPIDDSGAPIRASSGDLAGIVLVFRDVTERRTAELAALRLASIIQNSDDAIIGKNLEGIVTSWNEGAQRIFGYNAQEMIGKSIKTIIPAELQTQEDEILARLRKGERVSHFETVREAKNGRIVEVSLSISPIKDKEGRIVGASKIARDITERKKAEKELAEAKVKLESRAFDLEEKVRERTNALEATIGELEAFSYSLTHDMRAPLRTIESFSEIVLQEHGQKIGPGGSDLLTKAIASARRMDRLILDLLAFTRLTRSPIQLYPVDVERLITGILNERAEFQAPNAEIKLDAPLLRVAGNEASLTQCVTNLLDNAVKFVPPGVKPRVRIHTEQNDEGVRLWIEDNGIGIDETGKKRLFQMFQRVHGTAYPGTGIGLAIVRKAVQRMGGAVGVESTPGKGSRFWLQLRGPTS